MISGVIRKGRNEVAREQTVMFEDVKIVLRNFAGKPGKFNRDGDRNFAILLSDYDAKAMAEDGWNVKWFRPREEGDPQQAYLPISLVFGARPPRVNMITSRGRTPLHESDIEILDWADIATVDVIIRPYDWTVNGATGRKAYLKTMFVTIVEDELDLKYNDDIQARAGRIE